MSKSGLVGKEQSSILVGGSSSSVQKLIMENPNEQSGI